MKPRKPITWREVFYTRNTELGLPPYCYECTSHSTNVMGYPQLVRDGFRLMHRWVWWKATGEIPEVVMHLCDNPSCINLEHLKSGTLKDNQQDMAAKGRTRGGAPPENKLACKLTTEQVLEIRKLYEEGISQNRLGAMFGVSQMAVSFIVRRVTYTNVG